MSVHRSEPILLCGIPVERAALAPAIRAAGGVPLIDLAAAVELPGAVPSGAWVRIRERQGAIPGDGPVLLVAGSEPSPVPGRPTWLEITEPGPVPAGFEGVVLRGIEAGGPCGNAPGIELLSKMPSGGRVILDAGVLPEQLPRALRAGAIGVVLSDVLLGLPELELPDPLRRRVEAADPAASHVVNGLRIQAGPLSPVLRRLLEGESFWELCRGWFSAADPRSRAWPAGTALAEAARLGARHQDLRGLLDAYQETARAPQEQSTPRSDEAVAIIGLGCRLPGASSVSEFWDNLLSGVSSIDEVPRDRWDPALFWDADRTAPDKTYAKIGGFLRDFRFDPRRFRIPPAVAKQVDGVQQTALESVADALLDAGYKPSARDEGRDFDRSRTAVILGNSMGGEVTDDYVLRVRYPAIRQALEQVPGFADLPAEQRSGILSAFEEAVKRDLPPITEDSMPGELSNVIAGRIANAFDLTGANFTVDAACASSMAAVQTAVKGLLDHDFDMAITGGADRSMGVSTYTKFCKIGALSPDHSAPFDASANGFVMGEGCGVLVLKRLSDAERDGDRIYALIRGIGASSDGKGKGITAPNPVGQKLALQRAYAQAGVDPVEVDLVEAHGTSTVVGDKVEVEALTEVIGQGRRGERGPIRIGSVKSNIGHLKSAAGAASLIKAALAVHHGVLPPSINFKNARPDVPFDGIPLKVQDRAEPWPEGRKRRAGVSAFGFGGTNFHVVLEQHAPGEAPAERAQESRVEPVAPRPPAEAVPVPEGIWAISADSREELVAALERGWSPGRPFEPAAPIRIAAAALSEEERAEQLDRALKVLRKDGSADLLRARGIYLEEEPVNGKLAFLFTGQGSQYIDMGLDLAERWEVVRQTFEEADRVMEPELGRPLTSLIRRDPSIDEQEQFKALQATEISQPATLAVDVAILRLLAAFGVQPDMVAGHSLGEYAAAVAAGMLSFEDALLAVSARGREMASVRIDDPGKMAGIATSVDTVREVLAEIPGYVVAANKNCPTQTVIAGETYGVEAAIEAFRSRGITVYPLPVSHAFHSRIVAPASEPLKKVLERLDLRPPRRPISTNVTSAWYPTGEGAREEAIDILARQVASPVEWIAQTERMYAEGARIFVECGPKRALSGFVVSTLKRRPHRALYTNHPKRGGVMSFLDALASLLVLGMPVEARPMAPPIDIFAEPRPRRATTAAIQARQRREGPTGPVEPSADVVREVMETVARLTGYGVDEIRLEDELEADLGIDTVKQAELVARIRDRLQLDHDPEFRLSEHRSLGDLARYAARRLGAVRTLPLPVAPVARRAAAPAPRIAAPAALPAPLPTTALPADALSALVEGAVKAGLSGADADALARAIAPALQSLVTTLLSALPRPIQPSPLSSSSAHRGEVGPPDRLGRRGEAARTSSPRTPATTDLSIVATGASIGLPGGTELFAEDNFSRILSGEIRIDLIGESAEDAILDQNVVRLQKDPQTGQGSFIPVEGRENVIRLAGVSRKLDLARDYGIDPSLLEALDITTKMAFAAGIEALKDAGIPLVRRYHETRSGKKVPQGWALPEPLRNGTGVVFASAFPGYTFLMQHMERRWRGAANGGTEPFDRRFLFQVLAMGHSQFAQLIGARGPNAQVNAACASTTQAIAIAEDWLRSGRAERVIVLGADDVTNETMLPWIGAGFLAAGAATTKDKVEEAALPFDRRRHGMILGAGAVGLVLEKEADALARGNQPIARLLCTRLANSAFHGTRLDPEHIAAEVDALVEEATRRAHVSRDAFAREAVFMSHETYTPAKGGSAAAEIESLRRAFGPAAKEIVIANTKGFTGHPMGAGIEDAVVLKALQYGIVPPVPNLLEPDPDLGELRLSRGGSWDGRYALRLAAGFGSQVALSAWEKIASGDERVSDARVRDRWLSALGGIAHPHLVIEDRTLRLVEGEAPALAVPVEPAAVLEPAAAPEPSPAPSTGISREAVLSAVTAIIANKTGYAPDELDPSYELEADLGIDTVKQAEIFGEVREQFGVAQDPSFRLADYATIEALAGWLAERASGPGEPVEAPAAEAPSAEAPAAPSASREEVDRVLKQIIAEKTGYSPEELDPEYELEADLGIDTVKQAEIFGEVRERFGVAQDPSFRLADYPTIDALAGWLFGRMGVSSVSSDQEPTHALTGPSITAPEDVPEPMSLSGDGPAREAPAEPAQPPEDTTLPPSFRLRRPVVADRPALPASRRLDERVVHVLGEGPFAVALRLEALERGATLEGDPDTVIDATADVIESFHLARRLDAHRPKSWICATRLGADPSWVDPEVGLVQGARAGFAKALGREWKETRARVVDTDPMLDDSAAARLVLDELCISDPSMEIFHDGERRRSLVLSVEESPATGGLIRQGAVVVLTGGTRGITARVGIELARRGPVKLALLARTAPGESPLDEPAEKARIKARLEEEGTRATPARIEAELRPLRAAEEARQTVETMRALGAEVRFYPLDMGDEHAVRDTLQQVREDLGFIDGVIHGAGIEQSRLIGDKTEEDFARVFDGKARGGIALARNLERVAWFASMGSVAGRFGNAGQVDYAAANEAMARVCLSRPRSLHVDWTAWADTGMAVRGGMERLLGDRGVELLPAGAGAALLVDMLAAGLTGEVVVSGRLGEMGLEAAHPLIDGIDFDGDAILGRRVLDPARDAWIRDHSIEGVPVLPGVMGLELMAGTAAELVHGLPFAGADDVRFSAPVKIHRDEPLTLLVRAEPLGPDRVRCTLLSERKARTGRALVTEHFTATLRFGLVEETDPLPPAFFAEEPLEREAIYRRFFHGPAFQVLESVEAVLAGALVVSARVDHAPVAKGLQTAPLILEAAFQAAGLHRMAVHGRMALPSSIESLRLEDLPEDGAELSVVAHQRGDLYDVDVDGPQGPVLRLRGFALIDTGPLPEPDRFPVPEGGWAEVVLARAVEADADSGPIALLSEELAEIRARGKARRQADRLAGRLAARRAVSALTGLGGAAFRISSLESGQPIVTHADGTVGPGLSICHREGRGWAVASTRGRPGLDLEAVALRPPSFARSWFTEAEIRRTAGDPVAETETWCAKEAVLKAFGTGMALHPLEVEVLSIRGHRAEIRLHGEARATWERLGSGHLVVSIGRIDGLVAAAALLADGEAATAISGERCA